jgi:Peptidase family M23
VRRIPEQLAIIAVALLSAPLPSYALPTPPPPPVRFGTVDWQWGSPEQGAGGAEDYLSGSVVRVNGHDVNKPVEATKTAPHIEFADPVPVEVPIYSVAGKKWVLGASQPVPGGFGPLAAVTGGLEPTGRKVFNLGQDNEAEFKFVLVRIDQPAGIAYIEPFFRACVRNPLTKKWVTCTGYVIGAGIEIPIKETAKIPIDINYDYFHFKVPDVAKGKIKGILSEGNLKKFGISTGASIAGSALSGSSGGGGSSQLSNNPPQPSNSNSPQSQPAPSTLPSEDIRVAPVQFNGQTMAPVQDRKISSGYGWRIHPIDGTKKFHDGIDFAVPIGTPVSAVASGRIIYQGWLEGYGNTVVIDHGSGYSSLYGHLSGFVGRPGGFVPMGAVIATSGNTGKSTGAHLHLNVRAGGDGNSIASGYNIDPRSFIRGL